MFTVYRNTDFMKDGRMALSVKYSFYDKLFNVIDSYRIKL